MTKTELRNEILTRRCEKYREIINEYRMAAGDGFNDLTDKYSNQISPNDLRFLLYMEEITDSLVLPIRDFKDKIVERIRQNLYYINNVDANSLMRKEFAANNDILNEFMHMVYGKSEAEEEKPVIGDVVELYVPGCDYRHRCVFLAEGDKGCTLMQGDGTVLTVGLENQAYILTKTSDYCDILGCLEKVAL